MDYTRCPACGRKRGKKLLEGFVGVYKCPKCNAIFGVCSKGESYKIVSWQWAKETPPDNELQYFDLTVLSADGKRRIHGWRDRRTGDIVQIG